MKRISNAFSLIFVALLFLSCSHDPYYLSNPDPVVTENCNPDTVYFVNDVLPLLQSSCAHAGCHDASSAQNGVIMTDYVNIVQTGHIKPGKPRSSKLYKVITGGGEESMPTSPPTPGSWAP